MEDISENITQCNLCAHGWFSYIALVTIEDYSCLTIRIQILTMPVACWGAAWRESRTWPQLDTTVGCVTWFYLLYLYSLSSTILWSGGVVINCCIVSVLISWLLYSLIEMSLVCMVLILHGNLFCLYCTTFGKRRVVYCRFYTVTDLLFLWAGLCGLESGIDGWYCQECCNTTAFDSSSRVRGNNGYQWLQVQGG